MPAAFFKRPKGPVVFHRKIAEDLSLDLATRDLLRYPLREYQFAIPVRMDKRYGKDFARVSCTAQ